MTISGYSNAIVDVMLGWLKGLANWVLRLFNLAGSVSVSPLLWLSQNWLKLLVFFLALGVILDSLIWLVRWRPYWVWFRKERVIVNDDRFFINADMDKASDWEGDLANNWDEHDYVVASTVVKRRGPASAGNSRDKRSAQASKSPRGRFAGTKVQRRAVRSRGTASDLAQSGASAGRGGAAHRSQRPASQDESRVRSDNIFVTELKKRDVSDSYEDEVFNVANLPVFDEFSDAERPRSKSRSKSRSKRR